MHGRQGRAVLRPSQPIRELSTSPLPPPYHVWQGSQINGSEGFQFQPFLNHQSKLYVYTEDLKRSDATLSVHVALTLLCSSSPLVFNSSTSVEGIDLLRFVIIGGMRFSLSYTEKCAGVPQSLHSAGLNKPLQTTLRTQRSTPTTARSQTLGPAVC